MTIKIINYYKNGGIFVASEKAKKPFYKKWWVWLLGIIIIAAIASGGEEDTEQASTEPKEETTEQPKKEEPKKEEAREDEKKSAKAGVLDETKFNKIQNGMTYEEVVKIIGGEGEVLSESGTKGDQFHTVIYTWPAEGSLGANANFTFQGNKLQNKAQMGVTESSDVTVTLDEFNKIQNGMSYEEVVAIIGGEGNMISESGEKGSDLYTVMYEYKGEGDIGANANFMFQGNKLQNKAQMGLK